jgi:hypothetical protein
MTGKPLEEGVILEGEVTEDGQLLVTLPPGVPRGRVRVTVELAPEHFELSEDDLRGLGLTAQEIAVSPELGVWGQESPELDGARFVEALRGVRPSSRW